MFHIMVKGLSVIFETERIYIKQKNSVNDSAKNRPNLHFGCRSAKGLYTVMNSMIVPVQKFSYLLAVLSIGLSSAVTAQNSKLISADRYIQEGKLQRAAEALDAAKQHDKTKAFWKTYAFEARMYYALFLDSTDTYASMSEQPLVDALASLSRSADLDPEKKKSISVFRSVAGPLQDALFTNGVQNYEAGDYGAAKDLFRGSYQVSRLIYDYKLRTDLDTIAFFYSGVCAELMGNDEAAIEIYNNMMELNMDIEDTYSSLGKLYMRQENWEAAEQLFAKGRVRYPGSQNLLIDELNYYLSQGRAPEAIGKFEEAIENDPENAELHFAMGTALQALIKLDSVNAAMHMESARQAYEKSIQLNPEGFDAYLNVGALYYNEGVLAQKALDDVPPQDMDRANELEAKRNTLYDQALPYFQKAAETYENDPSKVNVIFAIEVYRSLKTMYVLKGEYEKSKEYKVRMEELQAQQGGE